MLTKQIILKKAETNYLAFPFAVLCRNKAKPLNFFSNKLHPTIFTALFNSSLATEASVVVQKKYLSYVSLVSWI